MPKSTNVTLFRHVRPQFPDSCVSCRIPQPGAMHRFISHTVGWWTWIWMWFGTPYTVQVPVCRTCRRRIRVQYWARMAVCMLALLLGAFVATIVAGHYQGPGRKFLLAAIALACFSPFFLLNIYFPPIFAITVSKKTVEFEFRDRRYAIDFAACNKDSLYYS